MKRKITLPTKHLVTYALCRRCNGAPALCTVTVQAVYTEHKVSWCLETSRTCVVQRNVSTREGGKSRTVFSTVNLLLINPI
uniref:Uncharacterized protein n=1 Tax=Hyaloperonospora arabidopsidis (strain Emoy2) TaxID=559515 RepID=M4BFW3_HYAAE